MTMYNPAGGGGSPRLESLETWFFSEEEEEENLDNMRALFFVKGARPALNSPPVQMNVL